MVKMETRHPVGKSFGNEFPATVKSLCSYGGLKSQDLEKVRSTLWCSNIVQFVCREIALI